jgi:hypothetical protein
VRGGPGRAAALVAEAHLPLSSTRRCDAEVIEVNRKMNPR